MAKIDQLLQIVKDAAASDLHLASGSVPMVRVGGRLEKTSHKRLGSENIRALMYEILTDEQIRRFEKKGDLDVAYGVPSVARFRINLYRMQNGIGAAIRLIPDTVRSLGDLGFVEVMEQLVESRSGLMLVTGPTNSGKTTTLAAIVDHINTNFPRHIVTLEDPIEYIHENKNSLVSQRQVGLHVSGFSAGVAAALREDPDVIMIGELRDTDTIRQAVTAAETGLLVLGTLHTTSAAATVDRVIDVFPPDEQQQIRVVLADTLIGVVSQHLLTPTSGHGRVLAYELMTRTDSIADLIRDGKTSEIPTVIQSSRKQGMRLMDNHLKALVDAGIIKVEEAIRVSQDPSQFLTKSGQRQQEVVSTT